MRWRNAALLGFVLVACKGAADLSRPDEPAPEPEVMHEEPRQSQSAHDTDDDSPDAASEVAPSDDGSPAVEGKAPSPALETSSGAAPKAKAAPPLPKAKYTSVDASCGKDPGVGQKLAPFELATTSGKRVKSASFKGRVMVVNFWGTWCKPCLKELPEFDHLYRRYRQHGMSLIAIATDEDPVPVDEFVTKRKLAAKVLVAGESYANAYGSAKFPFTFVVDHTGTIRASYRGYRPECMGKLEADIRDLLERRKG